MTQERHHKRRTSAQQCEFACKFCNRFADFPSGAYIAASDGVSFTCASYCWASAGGVWPPLRAVHLSCQARTSKRSHEQALRALKP